MLSAASLGSGECQFMYPGDTAVFLPKQEESWHYSPRARRSHWRMMHEDRREMIDPHEVLNWKELLGKPKS